MPAPSTEFTAELEDVLCLLETGERMLIALHDLGAYEELPAEPLRRLKTKGNVLKLTRENLAEVPAMIEEAVNG